MKPTALPASSPGDEAGIDFSYRGAPRLQPSVTYRSLAHVTGVRELVWRIPGGMQETD